MSPAGPVSDAGIAAMRAIMAQPQQTMIGLDFDGTLAPIIDDPEQAYADQAAVDALAALGPHRRLDRGDHGPARGDGGPARRLRRPPGSGVDGRARAVRGRALGRRHR